MSYTIKEALADEERNAEKVRRIAELYPDARVDGNYWASESVPIEACNDLLVIGESVRPVHRIDDETVVLRSSRRFGAHRIHVLLHVLEEKNAELYQALVRFVAENY